MSSMILSKPAPEFDRDAKVEDLPKPCGYFVLIHIPAIEEKTAGGVHLPTDTLKREQYASVLGHVMDVGDLAYKDEKRFPTGPWVKVGDCIIIKPYAGRVFWVRIEGELHEFRIISDDEAMAVVPHPELIVRRD